MFLAHGDVEHRVGARAAQHVDEQRQRQPLRVEDAVSPCSDDAVRLVRVPRDASFEGATGAGAVRQNDRTVAGMSAKYRAAIASMRRGAMLPIDEKTI